tara:strand:- start:363 stop:1124 length:762 start_codon:yes stop_codon:yes gene_type:complete
MKILYNGCSYPYGDGLVAQEDCVCNIVSKELEVEFLNLSEIGSNNYKIFLTTLTEISKNPYDLVFVFFTTWPRLKFYPELDNPQGYPVTANPSTMDWIKTLQTNEGLTVKNPQDLHKTLLMLNHEWHWLMEVVRYVNILSTYPNVKFINSICHWDTGFFEQFKTLQDREFLPNELTEYTQFILNIHNRDDNQINDLFQNVMINEYTKAGDIQANKWVNLYNPWKNNKIDRGIDNQHPGPKSHQWMAQQILGSI